MFFVRPLRVFSHDVSQNKGVAENTPPPRSGQKSAYHPHSAKVRFCQPHFPLNNFHQFKNNP